MQGIPRESLEEEQDMIERAVGRRAGFIPVLLLLSLLPAVGCGGSDRGAALYWRHAMGQLDRVEANLPEITRTATRAAELYVGQDRLGLGADGLAAFYGEATGRSGGVMAIGAWWTIERTRAGTWKGVVLYCLRPGHLDKDLERIAEYNRHGSIVLLLGTEEMIRAAEAGGARFIDRVTIPAAPHDGLYANPAAGPDKPARVVQTYEAAAIATLWPWMGEFVAACTRQGKTPVMFQSVAVPTGMDRIKKHSLPKGAPTGMYRKWHAKSIPPVREGRLARAWLAMARKRLRSLRARELSDIRQAARRAVQCRQASGSCHVASTGHAPVYLTDSPSDAGLFRKVGGSPAPGTPDVIGPKDFVFVLGYHSLMNEAPYHLADRVRKAGASVAWSAATYRPEAIRTRPGEIFIDAQWEYGDADVDLPGYDVRILPTSGLLAVTLYGMVNAEIFELLHPPTPARD